MKDKPKKHVFVCINCREKNLKSCGKEGLEIRTRLVSLLATHPEKLKIRINKSGCLDMCEHGPCMVIYPNNVWYKNVKLNDCEEIFKKSILNDSIIKRLEIKEDDWGE